MGNVQAIVHLVFQIVKSADHFHFYPTKLHFSQSRSCRSQAGTLLCNKQALGRRTTGVRRHLVEPFDMPPMDESEEERCLEGLASGRYVPDARLPPPPLPSLLYQPSMHASAQKGVRAPKLKASGLSMFLQKMEVDPDSSSSSTGGSYASAEESTGAQVGWGL